MNGLLDTWPLVDCGAEREEGAVKRERREREERVKRERREEEERGKREEGHPRTRRRWLLNIVPNH